MIRFEKVFKRFRRQEVLKGIDLEVARGHRIALVGSNGAGKTTLIRCLLGEYVCEGAVRVDGRDPRQHRQQVLSRIGFVPQKAFLFKGTVASNVRYGKPDASDEDVRRALETARLYEDG